MMSSRPADLKDYASTGTDAHATMKKANCGRLDKITHQNAGSQHEEQNDGSQVHFPYN